MTYRSLVITLLVMSLPFQSFGIFNFGPGYTHFKYHSIGTFARPTEAWLTGKSLVQSGMDGGFNSPQSVVVDSVNDRIYVTDQGNSRINKFVLSSGVFLGSIGNSLPTGACLGGKQNTWCKGGTFSSGSSDGMFNQLNGLAVDPVGDFLYVADKFNNRVQKFVASTGAFVGAIGNSTASGTCVAGKQNTWCTGGVFSSASTDGTFNWADSIAIDVTADVLYVLDLNNLRVQSFTLSTGAFIGAIGNSTASGTCIAGKQNGWCTGGVFSVGSGDGMFNVPRGLALNTTTHRLIVADQTSHRVQLFNSTTGAFIGAVGNSTASGTCIAGKQNGWCTGGTFSSAATDGTFNQPNGLSVDSSLDAFFVSDKSNHRLLKFTMSTGAFVGSIGNSTVSAGTCLLGKQTSWCTGGTFASSSIDGGFWNPLGASGVDSTNGYLYVTDVNSSRVQKFNSSTGAYVGTIGAAVNVAPTSWAQLNTNPALPAYVAAADGSIYNAYGLAVDTASDRLYVSSLYGNNIQKFVLSTGVFLGAIGNSTASGTCVAGKQTSWCTGGSFTSGSGDGMFSNGYHIALDTTNDFLYVADVGNARIQKFVLSTGAFVGAIGKSTASGTCIAGKQNGWCTGGTSFGISNNDGGFNTPQGIAVDGPGGFIYVADTTRIQKYTTAGAFVGNIGYAASSTGTCVVGAQSSWCTGGSFSNSGADGGSSNPLAIVIDLSHGFFYVSDSGTYRINKYKLTSGAFVGAIGFLQNASGTCRRGSQKSWCTGFGTGSQSNVDGGFASPLGLAIDTVNQRLFIGEGNRVQRITP